MEHSQKRKSSGSFAGQKMVLRELVGHSKVVFESDTILGAAASLYASSSVVLCDLDATRALRSGRCGRRCGVRCFREVVLFQIDRDAAAPGEVVLFQSCVVPECCSRSIVALLHREQILGGFFSADF